MKKLALSILFLVGCVTTNVRPAAPIAPAPDSLGSAAGGLARKSGFIPSDGPFVPPSGLTTTLSALGGQARVTGTCTSPNAIRTVAADGTVTCTTGVVDTAGTGLVKSSSTLRLGINGDAAQTCGAGTAVTVLSALGITTCAAFGSSSLTNSAGANVVMKSNGTNAVASSISDDGTQVTTAEPLVMSEIDATQQSDTSTGAVDGFVIGATTTTVVWAGASTLTISSMTGCTRDGRRVRFVNNAQTAGRNLVWSNNAGSNGTKTWQPGAATSTLTAIANGISGTAEFECDLTGGAGATPIWFETSENSTTTGAVHTFTGVTTFSTSGMQAQSGWSFSNTVTFATGASPRDTSTAGTLSANCTSGGGSSITTGKYFFTITVGATSVACTVTPVSAYNSNTPTIIALGRLGDAPGFTTTGTPVSAITLTTVVGGRTYDLHVLDH